MELNLRPIVKPSIDRYIFEKMICFRLGGKIIEVDDENQLLSCLLKEMNGENTIEKIVSNVLSEKSNVSKEDILTILKDMDEMKLLEDKNISYQDTLTEYDAVRWSRNINFFGSFCKIHNNKYDDQKKLQTTKITLLGLGGLGTHIIYDLIALGVKDIVAVDFDKVELSNLNRQILYSENDIGKKKIVAAKERIDQFYKENSVTFIERKISCTEDIRDVISHRDIVICVADKPKMLMQKWLNEACVQENIPYIQGGIDVQRAVFYTVIPGVTGCTECWTKVVQDNNNFAYKLIERDLSTDFLSLTPAPAIVTLVAVLTGNMVTDFLKLRTGIAKPISLGKLIEISFDTMQPSVCEEWEKHENCPICSAKSLLSAK